jgi:hydroxymethylglutaryl-CoA reductase
MTFEAIAAALERGGLGADRADKLVENVLGTYALPFAVGTNFIINGEHRIIPMVVEEPSVVAAASNAAKMIAQGGGFTAEADPPLMITQVQLDDVPDPTTARQRIIEQKQVILDVANHAVASLVARGGSPPEVRVSTTACL